MTEPLLTLAEELERRDERAAGELAEVERLGREVERARAGAEEAAAFLESLPAAREALAAEARAAQEAHASATAAADEAAAALQRAEDRGREDERLAAARAVQHARDDLQAAELRVARAQAERVRLELEEEQRRARAGELEGEARSLAARLAAVPQVAREAAAEPEPGLAGVLAWSSRARGGLLVAAAGIAAERERVGREAAELLGSVSGDAFAPPRAAGLRARVARVLGTD